jgi:uncharacterized protein (TIGR02246 family)
MISSRSKAMVALISFFALGAAGIRAQKPANIDADKAAIKQCVAAFSAAWNSHDARATAMRYEENGDFSSTTAVESHGWKELEEHYNMIFTTFLKDAHRTDTVRSIRFLTPDMASVDIDWQMTGARTREGAEVPFRKGLLTWIVTRHGSDWLITIYHESVF